MGYKRLKIVPWALPYDVLKVASWCTKPTGIAAGWKKSTVSIHPRRPVLPVVLSWKPCHIGINILNQTTVGATGCNAWERKVEVDFDELAMLFISKDDLIVAKRTSGHLQDMLDADTLAQISDN